MKVKELKEHLELANEEDDIMVCGVYGISTYVQETFIKIFPEMYNKTIFFIAAPVITETLTEESYLEDVILRTEKALLELKEVRKSKEKIDEGE